jgi:benzoylformate decarboxylase
MTAAYVLKRIAALRPRAAVIVEEAPTARGPEHDTLPITREGGFYTAPAAGSATRCRPRSACGGPADKVIAILGDGSAMYTIQGLFSARRKQANVSFVILNNGAYAALTGFSAEFGMNHVPGCDLTGIDFVKLAEAQGLPARLVGLGRGLDEALAGASRRRSEPARRAHRVRDPQPLARSPGGGFPGCSWVFARVTLPCPGHTPSPGHEGDTP